jgi:hypothetical protein
MRKVISFGLYGNKDIYNIGAIENAKLVKQIYGEEWEGWFYICEKVDIKIIEEIKKYAKVIIIKKDFWIKSGTFWRMLPIDEDDVDIMMVRDVDSRLSIKEKKLVDEWLKTDKKVHIMRDHPIYNFRIMAGLFNIRKNGIKISELLRMNNKYNGERYLLDQLFLQEVYYPMIKNDVLIHDSYHKYEDETITSFPITKNFIGERVNPLGLTEKEDFWKRSEGRYIYFVEEMDCFNTEQCCAFLYKLMEYIQIARKTNRTLVLPNIYLSPRDNVKSVKEGRVVINKVEYIGLDNFLDIDEIRKLVNTISQTDYYQILLDNKYKSLLISKPGEEIPIINNKIFTQVGKIEVDNIEYKYSSLNILNMITNEIVNEFESIIVYNYNRLGNPTWYDINELEYIGIRHTIVFNNRLKEMADRFVEDNNIRKKNTLMFHWRRGDKANIDKMKYNITIEKETYNWFMEHSRICNIENVKNKINLDNIEQVLLITNSGDEKELEEFKNILVEKNIKLIEMSNNMSNNMYNNLAYHDFDMMSIIVGAQCKYHLHSPANYNRMSMFGRWMLEEKYIYYTHNNWFYNIKNDIKFLY